MVEFMYLVFTGVPGESYRRRLGSLLLCYVFRALINSLVLILHERSGPRSVSDLHQVTSNVGITPLTDLHGWNEDAFTCPVM